MKLPLSLALATTRLAPAMVRVGAPACVATSDTLHEPSTREAQYGANVAKYLVDIHDSKGVFDFCGGMMFQLVLSEKLRSHLAEAASSGKGQPVLFDASKRRMSMTPGYGKSAEADNTQYFHGREVRQIPDAAGGMGFAIHLSLANSDDPEGWTPQELAGYDGWGHDSGRVWRKGERLEDEGFTSFRSIFGPAAYTLHHRFYLHLDQRNQLWLSAEDGCEGQPASLKPNLLQRMAMGFSQ